MRRVLGRLLRWGWYLAAIVLVLCAVRQGPGNAERTAVMLRNSARAQLASGVGMLRLLTTLVAALRRK